MIGIFDSVSCEHDGVFDSADCKRDGTLDSVLRPLYPDDRRDPVKQFEAVVFFAPSRVSVRYSSVNAKEADDQCLPRQCRNYQADHEQDAHWELPVPQSCAIGLPLRAHPQPQIPGWP